MVDKYSRNFNFTDYQTSNPSDPLPGNQVDSELNEIVAVTGNTIDALADVRRDDGKLKNGIVTKDALASSLLLGLNSATDWTTATAYDRLDGVWQSRKLYYAAEAHTSGAFATDLAAGKWVELVDLDQYVTIAETKATEAAASATAAATSETNAETAETNAATSETNAAASATAAATSETNAAASATEAETAADRIPEPQAGDANKTLRVKADETGYEAIDAATQRSNLGLGDSAEGTIGTDVQAFNANIPTVAASQAEMEAGTEAALRSMTPERVAQAIAALADAPVWAKIGEQTMSATTQVDFTTIDWNTYAAYKFILQFQVSADANLRGQFSRGGVFLTGASDYMSGLQGTTAIMVNADTHIRLAQQVYKGGANYNEGCNAEVTLIPASPAGGTDGMGTSLICHANHNVSGTGNIAFSTGGGAIRDANFMDAIDGVRFSLNTGNFVTGKIAMWGLKA